MKTPVRMLRAEGEMCMKTQRDASSTIWRKTRGSESLSKETLWGRGIK